MLIWYVTTIIIYFIIILSSMKCILERATVNGIKYNLKGIGAVLYIACIPVLRLLIAIALIYLTLCDTEIIISFLKEEDEE